MDFRQYWFNRQGEPIDAADANALFCEPDYKRVALTHITSTSDPSIDLLVSTVWVGVNYNWGAGPPLIFETMVFGGDEEWLDRYSTERQAVAGHKNTITLVAATVPDEQIVELDVWPKERTTRDAPSVSADDATS